ncbi:MAG TPA: hypothetical protein VI197_19685, partial [Polyangiaceae bacterium]
MSAPAASCAAGEAAGELEASGALGLRLGHSCHRMLVWECARIAASAALGLPEALVEAGYTEG